MYKRALMLTAATVALLSGPAFGDATDITTKTTKTLTTADDGPITLDTDGSIIIPSNSSATDTSAAVEINSTTAANNVFTSVSGTTLSYNDTSYAEAIQADPDTTGEIISNGTIDLTGSGTEKNAIVFGDPSGDTTGTFTGITDTTNNDVTGDLTALVLQSSSTLSVEGDSSSAIEIVSDNTVKGDILIDGAVTAQATSLTSTTDSSVTAINIAGTLDGSLSIQSGGSVKAAGAGAEGILDLGYISGSISNYGGISSVGLSKSSTKTTGNPEAGSALIVSNNVDGGIYNAGPDAGDTTTSTASISTTGTLPAMEIVPGYDSTTAAPITIGGFTDPAGLFGAASILNRGSISATPTNYDSSATAIVIDGVSTVNTTTLTDGIVNAGSIAASAVTDSKSTAAESTVTGLSIGNFVDVGYNTGTAGNGYGGGYALVNAGDAKTASISASVSGDGPATAIAIDIGSSSTQPSSTGTTLTSLFNSGAISATASSTDLTIANLSAYAIIDNTGTLVDIYNTGSITASSTTLNNNLNISRALSLQDALSAVTITNYGTITGDILLGSHADTISVLEQGSSAASITGNIFFGGDNDSGVNDQLTIGNNATVTGNIFGQGSNIEISIASSGTLDVKNNGETIDNLTYAQYESNTGLNVGQGNLTVSSLSVANNGTLDLTLAQAFNQQSDASSSVLPVVEASTANGGTGTITLASGSILNLNFGSFVSSTTAGGTGTSRFVIFDSPQVNGVVIEDPEQIITDITNDIPFLFNGSVCGQNIASFTGSNACTGDNLNLEGSGHSDLVLDLTPKAAGVNASGVADSTHLGLKGYALKMFSLANQALANDPVLGAEVIAAGNGLTGQNVAAQGQKIYQAIYSSFAPDVTGADRAVAISITDQATSAVGARQRALRMYAGLDGDATLWGQQFGGRLNTGNSTYTTGYANTGFGFALGADSGNPHDGRYGGAFTFYSGTTSEKAPRTSKTLSDWLMLTGYSDWRGKDGYFFDSQLSAAYGDITGKRSIVIGNSVAKCNNDETCTAQGKRGAAMLAGGVTGGQIYHMGGTVFIPQLSIDAMTMREEGYTEATPNLVSQASSGFDLHVKPFYASSVRAFLGADIRQDLKFGDYFVQPEMRGGFRYDALNGAQKLKAEFACSAVATGGCGDTSFSITGPDPAKGNIVLGGGIAVTTGAWSLGVSYDYLRGVGGVKSVDQSAALTLVGRI